MSLELSSQCSSPFYLWREGSGICGRAREAEKLVFANGSKANVCGSGGGVFSCGTRSVVGRYQKQGHYKALGAETDCERSGSELEMVTGVGGRRT